VKVHPLVVVATEETTVAEILPRLGDGAALALDEGRVFVGKRRAVGADNVRPGDEVLLFPARLPSREPARILAEREGVIAAYKPADMATVADHRGAAGTLETEIARLVGGTEPPTPTSRLDVGVSGIVLFAANETARRLLAKARETGRYLRHYIALAHSSPNPERGTWTESIGRSRDPRLRQVGGKDPETAETAYATIERTPKTALLAVEPKTGRTHQIRVHAAHAHCPLWGDAAYGGMTRLVSQQGTVTDVGRIGLHAAWVEVPLPRGRTFRCEAPLPAEFEVIWTGTGGDPAAFARAWAPVYPSPT
jgi:23S rRNA-/tRNA-specific pseudouridylate synthase